MASPGDLSNYPRFSIGLGIGSAILVLLASRLALLALAAAGGAILLGYKAARSPSLTYRNRKLATGGLALGMSSLTMSAIITLVGVLR